MIESFIIMLREGVEAALIIGIILIYLQKIGRTDLHRSVYWGLCLAVGASLLGALALTRLNLSEEVFEGAAMLLGALFVGTMVMWMWRTARRLKGKIEDRVNALAAHTGSTYSLGLIAFTFVMILREGVEAVLFLGAVNLTTHGLLSFSGGLLGLGLAVAFGISFFKGAIRIDLGRFFKVTGIVLLVFAVQLLIGGIHEFAEAGIIPVGAGEMQLIGPVVKNDVLFILAIIALPLILTFIPGQHERAQWAEATALQGAQRRKRIAQLKRVKLWRRAATAVGITVMIALTVNYAYSGRPRTIDPPKLVGAQDGLISIDLTELNDGNLHRFGYQAGETVIRFLAIKGQDERPATAFDACQICGAYGYVQEGSNIVCLNCAADIYAPTIGQGGGCNPIPLASRTERGHLIVAVDDLMKGGGPFAASGTLEVTDPVCGMKLHLADAGAKVPYDGQTVYLCKMPQCALSFRQNPEKYIH